MAEGSQRARVGIRELRQNLSIYVERVKDGETLEVTEYGHPVAELGPIKTPSKSSYDQLVVDGRIKAAKHQLELPTLLELPDGSEPLSVTLQKVGDEEYS